MSEGGIAIAGQLGGVVQERALHFETKILESALFAGRHRSASHSSRTLFAVCIHL
jgi:hypothetical protein